MLDVQWCKAAVSQLSESRWQTFRLAEQFAETLDDARAVWQDRAGREIDNRFLLPHAEETQTLKTGVQTHTQCLTESTEGMTQAEQQIQQLTDRSYKLRAAVHTLEGEIDEVYSKLDGASRCGTEAAAKLQQTRQLLASI